MDLNLKMIIIKPHLKEEFEVGYPENKKLLCHIQMGPREKKNPDHSSNHQSLHTGLKVWSWVVVPHIIMPVLVVTL